MENLSRRRILSLSAALGFVSVAADVPKAWSWSSIDSLAGTDTVTDPFWVWDDAIDPLAASLLDNGQVPAVNAAFANWANNSDPLPAGLPADLAAYLQQFNTLPSWADPAKLALAAQFNQHMSSYMFVAQSLGSGIESTVIPREARNVYYSAGGADMKARAAKTFTFGYDLYAPDAFEPSGHFVVTANKTRVVHAAVRHLLPQSTAWEAVTDEQRPISNGDILRTFHTLGTYVHRKLLDWQVPMTSAEEDAYLHLWQVALHLLGVRDDFLPISWAAAEAQAAQILAPNLAPTPEGIELAHILLGYISNATLGLTQGLEYELARYLLSDEIGDWLELFPRDYVSRALIDVGWPAYIAFREGLSWIVPDGFSIFDQFVKGMAMLFLTNGTSTTNMPITIPTANRPGT